MRNNLKLLRNALVNGPWMLILHAGPISKVVGHRVIFLAKGCRYVDGQIEYEPTAHQIGYTRDPGFIQQAKNEALPLSVAGRV